eukprot:Hpha_TRINITY_DN19135_c0_g1::TRINITY_DN19135_c0_g1_i1::g.94841::m.94841
MRWCLMTCTVFVARLAAAVTVFFCLAAGRPQWPDPGSGGQRSARDTPASLRHSHRPPPARRSPPPPPRPSPAQYADCPPLDPPEDGLCHQTFTVPPAGRVRVVRRTSGPGLRGPGAGAALAARLGSLQLRGATFVEVSAGVGLVSAVAARLGARVTATEPDTRLLELLQRNTADACASLPACPGGPPVCLRLDWRGWGTSAPPLALSAVNAGRGADYVAAADAASPGPTCGDVTGLGGVLVRLVAAEGRLVYAHTLREAGCDARVDRELRRLFAVASVERYAVHLRTEGGDVHLSATEGSGGVGDVLIYFLRPAATRHSGASEL